jgi:hypothetical protein
VPGDLLARAQGFGHAVIQVVICTNVNRWVLGSRPVLTEG